MQKQGCLANERHSDCVGEPFWEPCTELAREEVRPANHQQAVHTILILHPYAQGALRASGGFERIQ